MLITHTALTGGYCYCTGAEFALAAKKLLGEKFNPLPAIKLY
jgi:hypothetical protein